LDQPRSPVNSLVICAVPNENALLKEYERLASYNIDSILFQEPDRNNEATAFCTEPISKKKRKLFSKWKLWKEK